MTRNNAYVNVFLAKKIYQKPMYKFTAAFLLACILFHAPRGLAQSIPFSTVNMGNTVLFMESASMPGDFDGDGDMDLLNCGYDPGNPTYVSGRSRIYRNDGFSFTELPFSLTPIMAQWEAAATLWEDIDLDGDLDIYLSGTCETSPYNCGGFWENLGNGQFAAVAGAPQIRFAEAKFGDMDNDGDPDLFVGGINSSSLFHIYRNDGNWNFSLHTDSLVYWHPSDLELLDLDRDGDLDLFLYVSTSPFVGAESCYFFTNDGNGNFTDAGLDVMPFMWGDLDVGDYNDDGYPDLVYCGLDSFSDGSWGILRNDSGTGFTDLKLYFDNSVAEGGINWGDLDNDGDLDVLVNGRTCYGGNCYLRSAYFLNQGNDVFSFTNALPHTSHYMQMHVADMDNDLDIDITFSAVASTYNWPRVSYNQTTSSNTAPQPPENLSASAISPNQVLFQWTAGSDNETDTTALTYNLRIGTSPGASDIMSAKADTQTGRRYMTDRGNVEQNLQWQINGLQPGTYYWSVQSVDNSYIGSVFAPEQTFTLTPVGLASEMESEAQLQLWPNPAQNILHLKAGNPGLEALEVELWDDQGRLIATYLVEDKVSINTSDFANGIYFLRLKGNKTATGQKIVIRK